MSLHCGFFFPQKRSFPLPFPQDWSLVQYHKWENQGQYPRKRKAKWARSLSFKCVLFFLFFSVFLMVFSRMSCPGLKVSRPYGICLLRCDVPRHSNTKARRELHSGILASLTLVVNVGEVSVSHSCLSLQLSHGEFCNFVVFHLLYYWNRSAASFPIMNIRKNKFLVGQKLKSVFTCQLSSHAQS